MDLELTRTEKVAVLYAIKNMIAADGVVHPKEMELLNKFCHLMDAAQPEFDEAFEMSNERAMNILKQMSQDKRNLLAYILQDIARADGIIDQTEQMYFIKLNKELKFTNLNNI